jgi:hypothetical protein
MALNNAYKYDVFISYKREDHAWAKKLEDSLRSKGLEPWLDDQRLQPGLQWEPKLVADLYKSQHLVALWSKEAAFSEWVRREIYTFDADIYNKRAGGATINRHKFIIFLEGEDPPYPNLQFINELREAYPAGISQVDPNLWMEVVSKIEKTIRSDDTSRPVPLVIMAMDQQRLGQLDPDKPFPIPFPGNKKKSLSMLLKELDIASMQTIDDLKHYYGNQARDWKPFGSNTLNIWTIMETLKDEINQRLPGTPIRWDLLGDDLWSGDYDVARNAAKWLTTDWSVIVIDPLSLYDADISRYFDTFIYPALENPKAVFMALPPFEILTPYVNFRLITERTASRVYEHFYNPSLPHFLFRAKCNVNIGDKRDIKQWLLTTLGLGVSTELSEPNKNSALRQK